MGFNNTTPTLSLTAKLTPLGRQKMVSTNNALIKSFSLGDSDANYLTTKNLISGEIPNISGLKTSDTTINNSSPKSIGMKSQLIVNTSGQLTKLVSSQSIKIISEEVNVPKFVGTNNNSFKITKNSVTDNYVNLYHSFGLPLTTSEINKYTNVLYSNGGYLDTALSGFSANQILVIPIDQNTYGECIDGKSIKIVINGGDYTIYSTFENGKNMTNKMDVMISDNVQSTNKLGDNVAMLVSNDIKRPNNDPSLSWETGFGLKKPFSTKNKMGYNLQTNPNLGVTADSVIGIAFLDKGFFVITNPFIVTTPISSISLEYDSVVTNVYQSITCIADRGEFGSSTNTTFNYGDVPRISEIGLFDEVGDLIAIAKTDRHVLKNVNDFLALGIKISL